MKRILINLILLSLFTVVCFSQGDNMDMTLNGIWKFQFDRNKSGKTKNWFENRNFTGMMEIKVPGFWETETKTEHDGWGWYYRSFNISEIKNKIAIIFDGVDDNATVWINGQFIGTHNGYSESFFFDITNFIKKGENIISVLVEDTGGPGGINKNVHIKSYTTDDDLLRTPYSKLYARRSPDWVNNAVIYELYPRSFSKEGSFNAIIPKLRMLKDLGIDIIWLMPVNPIGIVNRKGSLGSPYAVKDFMTVNHEYGSENDFQQLVKAIHQNGLKVIVDIVINHSAWDNALISSNPEFYTKDKSNNIISPNQDWYDVADFNYRNKNLRRYMIDMMKFWVEKYDIDGFRCDVAELVPTDFWEEARNELENIKPIFILSEGSIPEHHVSAFDMTYSWNIYDALVEICNKDRNPSSIFDLLKNETLQYPKNSLRMRFNENHDKKRAVEVFGKSGAFITAALVNMLPGVPLIYSGQEVGEDNFSSLFEKVDVRWGDKPTENEFFVFYKKLNSFRKSNAALVNGTIKKLNFDNDLLVFTRNLLKNNVLCIFNFAKTSKNLDVKALKSSLKVSSLNLKNGISRNCEFKDIRMGRPSNDNVTISPNGFIIITY